MDWFYFHRGAFENAGRNPLSFPDDEHDWEKLIRNAGYELHDQFGSDVRWGELRIFFADEKPDPWLVDFWTNEGALITVLCKDFVDVMMYLRDYCAPVVAMMAEDFKAQILSRADEILFDAQTGLACAERWHRRSRALIRLRKEREQRGKDARDSAPVRPPGDENPNEKAGFGR